MNDAATQSVASQLAARLRDVQKNADRHRSPALALRAALRQGVGKRFGDVPTADAALLSLVSFAPADSGEPPPLTRRVERVLDDAMTVASLVAMTKVRLRPVAAGDRRGSLGRDLRALHDKRDSGGGAEDLLTALLGSSHEELPRHLRRAISLLAAAEIQLDARALLRDLGDWDADDRRVHKRWAYDFWVTALATESDQPTEEETA